MPDLFIARPRAGAPAASVVTGALRGTEAEAGRDTEAGPVRVVAQGTELFRPIRRAPAGDPDPARPAPAGVPRPSALDRFAPLLDDPAVTDIFVNGGLLFVDRGHGAEPVPDRAVDAEAARDLAVALIEAGGRHLDDAQPCVDVRLDGGIRVHAVLSPIAVGGAVISIRVPRVARPGLEALERAGMFSAGMRRVLEGVVARRENVLVTGPAGAGKTTLLAALLSAAPASERIITVEDVAELALDHPHHVRLEARQANLEGAGGVGLARLVREALRMRPDRLVVGECRGEEVRELLAALNTGHDGGAGTVHANGLGEVPARLEALGALARLDDGAVARQAASAIDVVLHVEKDAAGRRVLAAMGRPYVDARGRLAIEEQPCAR